MRYVEYLLNNLEAKKYILTISRKKKYKTYNLLKFTTKLVIRLATFNVDSYWNHPKIQISRPSYGQNTTIRFFGSHSSTPKWWNPV